jgi:hypothetical protein
VKEKVIHTVILSLIIILLNACAFVSSVSLTQIPKDRQNVVTASTEKFIILGFNFNNDYVDNIEKDLRSQCQGGEVRGILTKDEVISYFLAHTRKITATGFCVK